MKYIIRVESHGSIKYVNAINGSLLNPELVSMTRIFENAKVFESGMKERINPEELARIVEEFLNNGSFYRSAYTFKCKAIKVKIVLDSTITEFLNKL